MKFITRNLFYYALAFSALTILMKWSLTAAVDARLHTLPWIIAGAYGVITFLIGLFFGKKDRHSLPLYDAGFRYHLATFVVFTAVCESWHALGWMSGHDHFGHWRFVEAVWAVFIAIHFVTYLISRKKTIRGIEKTEIFD